MKRDINTLSRLFAVAAVALLSASSIPVMGGWRGNFNALNDEETDTIAADSEREDSTAADSAATNGDAELPWPQNIGARIEKLLDSRMFETSTVGLMVYDLTADSAIFRHNEKQLMRPASTMKMMVAVAALDRLGRGYRYRTTMETTAERDSNTLRGDLFFRGGFDPMVAERELDTFIDSLRSFGIDTIQGDIIADVSMKDNDRLGEGWCWDDDNPVLSPLLAGRKDEFTSRLLNRMTKAGIVHRGSLRTAKTPHSARTLCAIERPIGEVMSRMLKKSDNLYAESMFYQIAACGGGTATARAGRNQMNRLIQRLGFKPSRYYIADGSGLSLYNYVSPELEVAFLRHAYHSEDIYMTLLEHLPIAGEDGTLRERMRRGAAHGNVKAKTGTVTGVSSLAGYCTAANGHRLCFAIINMGIRHASSGRGFQDKVCEALCR